MSGSADPLTTRQPDGSLAVLHPLVYQIPTPDPYLAALSPQEQEAVTQQLVKIAAMLETIAAKMGMEPPLLLLPSGLHHSEFFHFPIYEGPDHPPIATILTINPRYISGLGVLGQTGQARPELCLSDVELYAVLAHELGHDVAHKTGARGMVDPTADAPVDSSKHALANLIAQNKNHLDEFEADAAAIRAGAAPDDLIRAVIKITRDQREQIMQQGSYGPALIHDPDTSAARPHETRLMGRNNLTDRHVRDGTHSHPSLIERRHAATLYAEDPQEWQSINTKHRDRIALQEEKLRCR